MRVDIKGSIVQTSDKWVYDWLDIESVCPRDVARAVDQAMGQHLDVYINSRGGDIFAGSEIYETLRQYSGTIMIHIPGLAASAASVIACAAKSEIAPTGMVMVHNVSSYAAGDCNAMQKSSETLKKADRSIAAAYMEKTGMNEADVLELMNKETWMTAADAVACGLVDSIAEPAVRMAAEYGSQMIPPNVITKIRNMVKNPLDKEADFLVKKARAELALLNLGGKNYE